MSLLFFDSIFNDRYELQVTFIGLQPKKEKIERYSLKSKLLKDSKLKQKRLKNRGRKQKVS
jgi:hypothetical protein